MRLAKLEKAVFDGFDGLYAQAKNQRSVGEIDSIISTVLSDPEIAGMIAKGKTATNFFVADDKQLRDLINTKLRTLPGITSAQPTTEQSPTFTPEQDAIRAANEKLARKRAEQGK